MLIKITNLLLLPRSTSQARESWCTTLWPLRYFNLLTTKQPHEDGPVYHPVVATVSLGSHSILHYYQYAKEPGSTGNTSLPSGEGRVVSSIPVMSVLLERRSLIITTDEMYSSRLHG